MLKRLLAKPLPPEQVASLVAIELNRIKQACKPTHVYLIGSAARNEMTDSSDLDFLVTFPDLDALKVGKKAYYASRRGDLWPVDVVFMTVDEYQRKSQIGGIAMVCAKEGQLVFEKAHD